ncbi:DUF1653 domain-containing protein [Micromonospora taraxaci]|uniref:DUF1653 domain-containing protein n=1 Tax=Micromonospora taraxaci TaxID=1316803 RepID=UPI00340945B6
MQSDSKIRLGKYRHYKGNYYEVLGLAHGTETREKLVIYRGLYDSPDLEEDYGKDPWFARPHDMFTGTIEVDGKAVSRFEFISPT